MLQILLKTIEKGTVYSKVCFTKSCCDLVYAVAKAISRHMDHVPNVQNHVTFRTHFNGLILSLFIIYSR